MNFKYEKDVKVSNIFIDKKQLYSLFIVSQEQRLCICVFVKIIDEIKNSLS